MLRRIKQLYGDKLGATDGDIGHVKDFYFDDVKWTVRYLVADTGSWLPGRLVLLSPAAFGNFSLAGDRLLVNLTREQIEKSPPIEAHKPVSRQYEEEYYRYYGWPAYWDGEGMWGMAGFPVSPPALPVAGEQLIQSNIRHDAGDPHLRSTKAVNGYEIQTNEGTAGHVTDFLIDDRTWAICQLLVKTGHWFSGKEIVIAPEHVSRISYEESMIYVRLTKEAILAEPEDRTPPLSTV